MKLFLTLGFLFSLTFCKGQALFYHQNDSAITQLYQHFSSCQTLTSSWQFNKSILTIDQSVVNLSNELYNNVFTYQQLQALSGKYSRTIYDETLKTSPVGDTEKVYFNPYFNGNLRIFYHAVMVKDSIVSFKLGFNTNSTVDCNTSGNIIHYFDFIYVKKYFLRDINFPVRVDPWTIDVVISRHIK